MVDIYSYVDSPFLYSEVFYQIFAVVYYIVDIHKQNYEHGRGMKCAIIEHKHPYSGLEMIVPRVKHYGS